jgi:acetyl esterase/lipase
VGQSEGRGVLDSVRAARQLPGSGATATSKVIVWGHSQGGGAALFAGSLGPPYAPGVDLVGVIAGAPAAELTSISSFGGPYEGFGLMAAAGFHAAYPDLALGDVLTPAGVQAAQSIVDECSDQILRDFANKPAGQLQKASPMAVPAWAQRFTENDPGGAAPVAPVFIYQGDADEVIPVAVSAALEQKLCALGATSFRTTYPGATHVSSILAALGDIQSWMSDRLAGKAAPSSC